MDDAPARLDYLSLPPHFEFDGIISVAEAVNVLQLDFRAKARFTQRTDAHVGFAAHIALFHVCARSADIPQDVTQLCKIGARLLRGAQIWFRDDFHERQARPVDVDKAIALAHLSCHMLRPGRVLFKMDACYSYPLRLAFDVDIQPSVPAEGKVVLGNLIALHEVRIVVILPVKLGLSRNPAVKGKARHDCQFDGAPVDHR